MPFFQSEDLLACGAYGHARVRKLLNSLFQNNLKSKRVQFKHPLLPAKVQFLGKLLSASGEIRATSSTYCVGCHTGS